jgi:hypothetical protein
MLDNPASLIGYLIAFATLLGTWFFNHRKADIDASGQALTAWQDLVKSHKEDMKSLREELIAYKTSATKEISDLRQRVTDLEGLVRHKDDEIAGLKRTIAQHSQSNAVMLGDINAPGRTGDNSRGRKP